MTETTLATLNDHETQRLEHCEAVIRRGLNTYVTVGLAIMEIREQRLYRATHQSFEAYARDRLECSREHAYRLIRAAAVALQLREHTTEGCPEPVREGHVRPLAALDSAEQQAEAWNRAVEAAGGELPTRAQVEEAVATVRGDEPKPAEPRVIIDAEIPPPTDDRSEDPDELGAPHDVINAARQFFGGVIDTDPCSSPPFQTHIRATKCYMALGLQKEWDGLVWCFPPRGQTNQGPWFFKARNAVHHMHGDIALVLLDADVGATWFTYVWQYPTLFFSDRLRFLRPDGVSVEQADHGSLLVCVHDATGTEREAIESRFVDLFGEFGTITLPVREGVVEAV